MLKIEIASSLFGIHNDRPGRHLPGRFQSAAKGIHKQQAAKLLALPYLTDRHPSQQCHPNGGAGWEFPGKLFGQFHAEQRERRKRVVAGHFNPIACQHKGGGDPPRHILLDLLTEVNIKRIDPATERPPIVRIGERLNAELM